MLLQHSDRRQSVFLATHDCYPWKIDLLEQLVAEVAHALLHAEMEFAVFY
jgi:hypothetical protein